MKILRPDMSVNEISIPVPIFGKGVCQLFRTSTVFPCFSIHEDKYVKLDGVCTPMISATEYCIFAKYL